MLFLNRGRELAELRDLRASGESRLALIYGRRRLGKTALLGDEYGSLCFRMMDQPRCAPKRVVGKRHHCPA